MGFSDNDFIHLMALVASGGTLSEPEQRKIKKHLQEHPELEPLLHHFSNPEWVRKELSKFRMAPVEEMWIEINRQLDELGEPNYIPPAYKPTWIARLYDGLCNFFSISRTG